MPLRRWWYWNYVKNEAWPPDVRGYFVRKSLEELAKAKNVKPEMQQDISAAELSTALCGKPSDLSPEIKMELRHDGFRRITQIPHEHCATCGMPVFTHLATTVGGKFYHDRCAPQKEQPQDWGTCTPPFQASPPNPPQMDRIEPPREEAPPADDAHVNLGLALGRKGDLDGAIDEFRSALHLRQDDARAHSNLGIALAEKGDLDAAIAEFHSALCPGRTTLGRTPTSASRSRKRATWTGALPNSAARFAFSRTSPTRTTTSASRSRKRAIGTGALPNSAARFAFSRTSPTRTTTLASRSGPRRRM